MASAFMAAFISVCGQALVWGLAHERQRHNHKVEPASRLNLFWVHRARPWRWSTHQIPLDFQFWLVKFP